MYNHFRLLVEHCLHVSLLAIGSLISLILYLNLTTATAKRLRALGYSFSGSWLHLVSMRLKHRMHVYLLIVVQKTVLTLYTGEVENSNIRFRRGLS